MPVGGNGTQTGIARREIQGEASRCRRTRNLGRIITGRRMPAGRGTIATGHEVERQPSGRPVVTAMPDASFAGQQDTLLGVLHRGNAEIRLLDTPGLHKPKSELGRVMNHFAREAARERRAHAIEPQIVLNDRPCVAVAWGPPASVRGERILQVGASLVPSALSLTKNVGASAL